MSVNTSAYCGKIIFNAIVLYGLFLSTQWKQRFYK